MPPRQATRPATTAGEQLLRAGLDIAYQPIVHLGSGSVLAYEALARPRHPGVRSPLEFFASLEEAGLRLEGERSAFRAAMAGIRDGFPQAKLFVNASPTTLVDERFDVAELLELAHRHELSPSDLVVEVTESEAVHDLVTLSRRSEHLRTLGIGLAVDDAGAGHASFRVITRLRPTYIKLDRDLVSNVDADGARHAFVEAMVRFSRQIGSRLVAEGIETDAELACLAGLGVEAGQGYYLARPAVSTFSLPSVDSRRLIAAAAQRLRLGSAAVTAGELARPAVTVSADATVEQAYALLCDEPTMAGVVVCKGDGQAVSQMARRELEQLLAGPNAWARLSSRRLAEVAGAGVVAVSAETDVIEAGAMIAARPLHETIQDLVVTDQRGRLVGVAPAREVIRMLADTRTRQAGGLHPLSGLPGVEWVEEELRVRANTGQPTNVLFLDFDRFRDINQVGGYALGDDGIRALARCLSGSVASVEGAAVAHVGGDDFLLLTPPQGHEELVGELVRRVETEVIPLIRVELRLRGAAEIADRIAVSMASVDLVGDPPPGFSYLDWARNLLTNPMENAKAHSQHSLVRLSGGVVTATTWSPKLTGHRQLSLGLVDPTLVVEALDWVARGWEAHLESEPDGSVRFPGPPEVVERLVRTYGWPLRQRAMEALEAGRGSVEVTLEGDEQDLLELLDRIVLVTRHAYHHKHGAGAPEVALLERLLRQRARSITREDRVLVARAADASNAG